MIFFRIFDHTHYILYNKESQKIVGQKTVPMSHHFRILTMSSDMDKIMWYYIQILDNML